MKNGLHFDEDGEIRYYIHDESVNVGVVKFTDMYDVKHYVYINYKKKAVKDCYCRISLIESNGLVNPGIYKSDENGYIQVTIEEDKTGFYEEDGILCYYKNGLKFYDGMFTVDDAYYYATEEGGIVRNCYYYVSEEKSNGLGAAGVYRFDENGIGTLQPSSAINFEDGVYKLPIDQKFGTTTFSAGTIVSISNGSPYYAGCVQYVDEVGISHLVFINSTKKNVKDCYYGILSDKTNGLIEKGVYQIDANGYIQLPEKLSEGLYIVIEKQEIDDMTCNIGDIIYIQNGVPTYSGVVPHELIDQDGIKKTVYYYFNSSKKAVIGPCYYGILSDKTNSLIENGVYQIDENGYVTNRGIDLNNDAYTDYFVPLEGIPEGLRFEEGTIRYYSGDSVRTYNRVVEHIPDPENKPDEKVYYYINGSRHIVKGPCANVYIDNDETCGYIEKGYYMLDENSHIIISSRTDKPLTG